MGGVTLTGPHAQMFEPRNLTVGELQRYIRPGCFCVVCSEAHAQIRERQKEATA